MPNEVWWKDIPGYEGMYQISSAGDIKSLKRHIENGSPSGMILSERMLAHNITPRGYHEVSLRKNGKGKQVYVHRLVADAFLALRFGETVNHIDGNKDNNNISNLEFITYAENNQHAYDTGLHRKNQDHYKAKLTNENVKEIKRLGKYDTYDNIAKKYGVSKATVRDVLENRTWKNIDID